MALFFPPGSSHDDMKAFMDDDERQYWDTQKGTSEERVQFWKSLEDLWRSIPEPTEAQLQQVMGYTNWEHCQRGENREGILNFYRLKWKKDRKVESLKHQKMLPASHPLMPLADPPQPTLEQIPSRLQRPENQPRPATPAGNEDDPRVSDTDSDRDFSLPHENRSWITGKTRELLVPSIPSSTENKEATTVVHLGPASSEILEDGYSDAQVGDSLEARDEPRDHDSRERNSKLPKRALNRFWLFRKLMAYPRLSGGGGVGLALVIAKEGLDYEINGAVKTAAVVFLFAWAALVTAIYISSFWDKRRPWMMALIIVSAIGLFVVWSGYLPTPPITPHTDQSANASPHGPSPRLGAPVLPSPNESPTRTVAPTLAPTPSPTQVVNLPSQKRQLAQKTETASDHIKRARSLLGREQLDAALVECNEALRIEPKNRTAIDLKKSISDLNKLKNQKR